MPILSLLKACTIAEKENGGKDLVWVGSPAYRVVFEALYDSKLWTESRPSDRPAQLFEKLIGVAQNQIRSASKSRS